MPAIASDSCDQRDRSDVELLPAGAGQCVDARALPGVGQFPLSFHEALPLEAVQRRIQRAGVDLQPLAGVETDGLADAVAVPRSGLQRLEDEEVERALQQLDVVLMAEPCHRVSTRYTPGVSFVYTCSASYLDVRRGRDSSRATRPSRSSSR